MRNSDLDQKELNRAKNCVYRFLTYRSRSRAEVEQKLIDKGFSEDIISAVLTDFDRLGYLNDGAFAAQWARSRAGLRGFGRRRIEQELRTKGISGDIVKEAVDSVFNASSEGDIARREAEKKLKSLSRFEPEVRRRRLAGFLERRGFSSDIIGNVLRSLKRSGEPAGSEVPEEERA